MHLKKQINVQVYLKENRRYIYLDRMCDKLSCRKPYFSFKHDYNLIALPVFLQVDKFEYEEVDNYNADTFPFYKHTDDQTLVPLQFAFGLYKEN